METALYALALDELPGSWAAGRERLRRRVRDRYVDGTPTAVATIEDLVHGETLWLRELWLLAEDPPDYSRLRGVAAKVWMELRRRRRDFPAEHFSEHVYEVLCAVFPGSPGAEWDAEWAGALASRAVALAFSHVAGRAPADIGTSASDEVDCAHDEVVAAAEAEDRCRYRRALREWVAAASRAADSGSSPLA